jgi:hypothetical protein
MITFMFPLGDSFKIERLAGKLNKHTTRHKSPLGERKLGAG